MSLNEKQKFEIAMKTENLNSSTWLKTWNKAIKDYKHLTASWAWRMWRMAKLDTQSKFVLISTATAQEALAWAKEAKWNSPDNATDLNIEKHTNALKRAIKVQENTNAI